MIDARRDQDAYDALLLWCSEVGTGDYKTFRAGCRQLDLPVADAARSLSQLGHVEFDWQRSRFAAAPTCLVSIVGLAGRLLLTGARPSGLLAELHERAGDLDVEISAPAPQRGIGPSSVLVEIDPHDAPPFADAAGVPLVVDAGPRLAQLLPPADPHLIGASAWPDDRFPHCTIDPETLQPRWDLSVPGGADALWLYKTWGGRHALYLRANGECLRLIAPEWGPYVIDRPDDADPLVRYEPAHRVLIVDCAAPLPALHARAACLCSGRLPYRQYLAPEVSEDRYVNIDPAVADRILGGLTRRTL